MASLAQTALGAAFVVVFALAGLDPVAQVFAWMAGTATLIGGSTGLAVGVGAVLVAVTAVGVVLGLVRRDVSTDTPDVPDRSATPRENA